MLDLLWTGQRREDYLGIARGGRRIVRPGCTAGQMRLRLGLAHVEDREGVAFFDEVKRHRPTHVAQSNESNFHSVLQRRWGHAPLRGEVACPDGENDAVVSSAPLKHWG